MLRSRAVYDLLMHAVRGGPVPDAVVARAARAGPVLWRRAIRIEQCAPTVERGLRAADQLSRLPAHARWLLRSAAASAVRNALLIPEQLSRIARIAERGGIEIVALKGAARLLRGEVPGLRSVDDIDLLVRAADAPRLHALLARELECTVAARAPEHHLPVLRPASGVPIELHVRCSADRSGLDELIWRDVHRLACGGATILVPDDTLLALHALDHAILTHWGMRYRLRDVLDVASACRGDVSVPRVLGHVRASRERRAMDILLDAAGTLESRVPAGRPAAWRTIARVGRTRLAASFLSRDPHRAERVLTASSVLAEGSLRAAGRLARTAWFGRRRRIAALSLAAAALTTLPGCADGNGPAPLEIPSFVFASDAEGALALYVFENDVIARLTDPGAGDDEPQAAGRRIVFSSMRDGNREVYYLPELAATPRRMTAHGSSDLEPALRSDGGMIAFVSSRSGTPRIWITDTLGSAPTALATGSSSFVPERGPAWSPLGDLIAFTSTRTGTSQVWVVPATGGNAAQVTHESAGAFDPAWSADGTALYYVALSGIARAMKVVVATGETSIAAEDPEGVGQPACTARACIAVRRPYGGAGDIVAFTPSPGAAVTVIARAGVDRHPSVIAR